MLANKNVVLKCSYMDPTHTASSKKYDQGTRILCGKKKKVLREKIKCCLSNHTVSPMKQNPHLNGNVSLYASC